MWDLILDLPTPWQWIYQLIKPAHMNKLWFFEPVNFIWNPKWFLHMQLIEFQSCRPGKLAHYVCCLVQKCLYCSCILQTMVDAAHPACILDTRKTAPGLHLVDKWVVWFTSSLVLHSNNLSIGFVYRFFLTCNILLF